MAAICPHCGQLIASERLGVRVTPLKARIVDLIKAAGDLGISTEDIIERLYRDRQAVASPTIKAHVWQINEVLAETRYSIVSDRRRWFLRKT